MMIYIAGIGPRTGTNYLYELLSLHPKCEKMHINDTIGEDCLLIHSHFLKNYVKKTSYYDRNKAKELYQCIGDGLKSFITTDNNKVVVTKTASIKNINLFPLLFPRDKLIILVRDGRDYAESCYKSFNIPHEQSFKTWKQNVQEAMKFLDSSPQTLMIKYEDLNSNLQETLIRIFSYTNLNSGDYDYQRAQNLDIYGPSGDTWKIEKKSEHHTPHSKYKSWPKKLKSRFVWIAEKESKSLGFETSEIKKFSYLYYWNIFQDIKNKFYLRPKK